jgi:hypothetical protein
MSNKLDWIKKSLLGSSTILPGQHLGHIHGPHCNHGHDHAHDHTGHVHGPGCNHGHDDDEDGHVHDENCNH